jgi:hypothetical protein
MPGKLPIDRVRANEEGPAPYELENSELEKEHA